MEVRRFSAVKESDEYTIPALVQEISDSIASNGNTYIKVVLCDGDQTITANQFGKLSSADYAKQNIQPGSIVSATVKMTKGYFNLNGMRLCADPDISISDFIKTTKIKIDAAYQYIIDSITASARPNENGQSRYADVALYLLETFHDKFVQSAAASSNHHDYVGGLLEHTANMVGVAVSLTRVYREIDGELLICGCALHDIGKLQELNTNQLGQIAYTLEGSLLGHNYIGTKLIENAYTEHFGRTIGQNELLLLHMIGSHHGEKSWGAIAVPVFKDQSLQALLRRKRTMHAEIMFCNNPLPDYQNKYLKKKLKKYFYDINFYDDSYDGNSCTSMIANGESHSWRI